MLAIAVVMAACASGPTPTQGPSAAPSSQPSPTGGWPSFEPLALEQFVAQQLGMTCGLREAHVDCQAVRDSGARFEVIGPDGTDEADRELSFTASGPTELESEARRLFGTVAGAVSGDAGLSIEWQDEIWAAFAEAQASPTTLPNGVSWLAARHNLGDVFVWSLSLTW